MEPEPVVDERIRVGPIEPYAPGPTPGDSNYRACRTTEFNVLNPLEEGDNMKEPGWSNERAVRDGLDLAAADTPEAKPLEPGESNSRAVRAEPDAEVVREPAPDQDERDRQNE